MSRFADVLKKRRTCNDPFLSCYFIYWSADWYRKFSKNRTNAHFLQAIHIFTYTKLRDRLNLAIEIQSHPWNRNSIQISSYMHTYRIWQKRNLLSQWQWRVQVTILQMAFDVWHLMACTLLKRMWKKQHFCLSNKIDAQVKKRIR